MMPITTIAALRATISRLNWVTINPQESSPRSGMSGIFAMVRGILKGRFQSGFLILSQIAERFTDAKTIKVPKLVISATTPKSPIRTKKQGD